jgi:hypothetical protein
MSANSLFGINFLCIQINADLMLKGKTFDEKATIKYFSSFGFYSLKSKQLL